MKPILKRLLNVITILASLWVVVVMFLFILIESAGNWVSYHHIIRQLIMGLLALLIVSSANYIFFGKLSLWHKNDKP
jgi:hypothetical protein